MQFAKNYHVLYHNCESLEYEMMFEFVTCIVQFSHGLFTIITNIIGMLIFQ